MKLYHMILKDIIHRKKRVLYATLGVVVGTMTVIAILTIALAGRQRIEAQLEKYGPNLMVLPATTTLNTGLGDLNLGTITIGETYIPQEKLSQMQSIADNAIRQALKLKDEGNIATVAPKLYISSEINGSSLTLTGIDPGEEIKVKTWWEVKQGSYLNGNTMDGMLVGSEAAKLLKLSINDRVTVKGKELVITGILEETGSNEDFQAFLALPTLQTIFNKEGLVSSVDIRALCNACPAEDIAVEINQQMSGVRAVAVKQVANTEMGMLDKINNLMLALAGVTLIVGGFGVVNTLMSSVNERIKDIGIMRAVGASRNQIIKILVYEAIIIGILGGIFGYIVGTSLAKIIGPLIFEGTSIAFVLKYLPLSLLVAMAIAALASLYPALRATKIRVADSFRSL